MSKTYVSAVLRQLVHERAGGACEYCLMPEIAVLVSHEVDHVIAEKHGGKTESANLALACTICNKHKGSDLASIDPVTGEIVRLFQPCGDCWLEHFQLRDGEIVPLTAIGRVTVRLLQLNRAERRLERKGLMAAGVLPPDGTAIVDYPRRDADSSRLPADSSRLPADSPWIYHISGFIASRPGISPECR
jgi:hypothetical protein